MSRIIYTLLLFALVLFGYQPRLLAQNSGTYLSNFYEELPEITQKGVTRTTGDLKWDYVPTGVDAPISTSLITVVGWTWALQSNTHPAGTVVQICQQLPTFTSCFDISNTPQGQTTFFENNSAFNPIFYRTIKLPGTGGTVNYLPNSNQLLVNYNV